MEQGRSKDMKKHSILTAIALTTTLLCGSVLCTSVTADTPDDRRFGNGRFLKRLRDEVTERTKPDPKKKENAKKPTKADPRSKGTNAKNAPTPAKRSAKGAPTPAARPSAQASQRNRPSVANPYGQQRPASAAAAVKSKNDIRKETQQLSQGFGMQIQSRGEQLVVTKTDSRGNAAEAGVRKGDVVLSAGGAAIGSVEELEEITKILGKGDQLEFEVARKGQKKKVLIQFGEAPEEDEVVITKPETPAKQVSNYDFLPAPAEPSASSLRSVLNDNSLQSGQRTPANVNRIPRPILLAKPAPRQSVSETQAMVEQQRLQIQQLQREIELLRRQTQSNSAGQGTGWSSPRLNGPAK